MIKLAENYHGIDLSGIADSIDKLFGFSSEWESTPSSDQGCFERDGHILIDLSQLDQLCEHADAGPADAGQVARYVFAHLKAHHYQDLNPHFDKSYEEDLRPYELEADLIAGWICAHARIPHSFRTTEMASFFNDFNRQSDQNNTGNSDKVELREYPFPEEREIAFRQGARIWANGQINEFLPIAGKLGIQDETFAEFLASAPNAALTLWRRPIPKSE